MKKAIFLSAFLLCSVIISYGQWSFSYLTEAKQHMGSASLGTKAYFAGGQNESYSLALVEYYDTLTGAMDVIGNLSIARALPSGGTCGPKVFFAGGCNFFTFTPYSTLDIWDTINQEWTVEQLSIPRFSIATESKDNRILFAGGNLPNWTCYDLVEIYDIQTSSWEEIQYLSQARAAMASAVVGDMAIFAGGVLPGVAMSDRVDIYYFTTNTWETATLSEARGWASATTVDDKVIIAGGLTSLNHPSDRVDIYNATTGTWTTDTLSFPRCSNGNAATVKGKAYFAGGGNFNNGAFNSPSDIVDVYDEENDTWSIIYLEDKLVGHSVIGFGNKLIVAGGNDGDNIVQTVEILDILTNIESRQKEDAFFNIFPNPANDKITIELPESWAENNARVYIYAFTGQEMMSGLLANSRTEIDISFLDSGLYFLKVENNEIIRFTKFIKN